MSKTFRQYDVRWGKKSYPPGSNCTMSGSGCGPTACADLIVNNPKYKNYTPISTRKFMINNGYAVAGHGTSWNGIDACLKHFGFTVKRFDSMEPFWEEMAKQGRRAIILFGAGSRGGITWTSSGHYVAASAYKKQNGKHCLYTRDPGGRCNDGWHCYEDTMRGLIKKLWVCYLPTSNVTSSPYKVGGTYTLQTNMNVRTGPGTSYSKKKVLKKGTKVTCKAVKKVGSKTWMQTPSGWICAKGIKTYIK